MLPLPPNFDCETVSILKASIEANKSLAQLRGEVKIIPNRQILIDTLALQEARDSNEIENIVTTDDELFQAAIDEKVTSLAAKEGKNYAEALKYGFEIIQKKSLLTNNDIEAIQNIISPNHPIRKIPGTALKNPATGETVYTPPQGYDEIISLFSNLAVYINDPKFHEIDALIKMPIIHYQFESIHPFHDGNGRTGRIINMLYLVLQGLLDIPVLYLSSYIIKNKNDYYRLLQEVRIQNNWEEWIVWMLKGVDETAQETLVIVRDIKSLMDDYKKRMKSKYTFYSHDLINILFKNPYTKIDFLEKELSVHRNTAAQYLNTLHEDGFLQKVKLGKSNYYINLSLLELLKNR